LGFGVLRSQPAQNPGDGVLLTDTSNPSGSSGPSTGSHDSFAASGLVEHFFRREYGRLVAILTRKVGVRHVDLVEDAVQTALMTALTSWVAKGLPEDPGAWLYRVAHNHLIGALRNNAGRQRILEAAAPELTVAADNPASPRFDHEVRDDLLRMLFVCCDEAIPKASRLVLALKTLCGFSTALLGRLELQERLYCLGYFPCTLANTLSIGARWKLSMESCRFTNLKAAAKILERHDPWTLAGVLCAGSAPAKHSARTKIDVF